MTTRERLGLGGAGAGALVVTVAGFALAAGGTQLGTADVPPFVMGWAPRASAWALLALVAAGVAVVVLPRLAAGAGSSPWRFVVGLTLTALALAPAINAARSGPHGWDAIFQTGRGGSFEAKNEYLPGLPALSYGARFFLDRYAELVPSLPVNVAGHPPGPLLLFDAVGARTAARLAGLCIAAAVALVPATYLLGRVALRAEAQARAAAVLAAASPCLLLFGTTSVDAIYALLGTLAAVLLVARPAAARAAGMVLLAVATLFSWALLAIAAWATIVWLRRDGPRSALVTAAGLVVAVVALQGALAAVTGYDPLATLRATEAVYRQSLATKRPYAFWVFGSPVAWALMLGAPIAAAALLAARRGRPEALAIVAVVAIAAVAGFTKAETERIWLPFVPLACVAAAPLLSGRVLRPVVGLLLAQALVVEVLFSTLW
jgi:hypothetical protein